MKKTLWRAATEDYIPDAASFAATREDAEAYLDNPPFGGDILYRARIETVERRILDLYDKRDPVTYLVRKYDEPHPGAIGVEEWIPRSPSLQESIHNDGYDWAVIRDSFPEDAETWIWLGDFEHEPELEEVAR